MKKTFYILFFLILFSYSALAGNADSNTYSSGNLSHALFESVFGLNEEYETPYYILHGKKTTPVMLIHGGMHGDEIASYLACEEILKNINIKQGTLVVIPRLNKPACDMNRRGINMDLNHAFPGIIDSETYEFRLAYELMYLVDSLKPDLIINLHEALTKYDSEASYNPNKAYGQVIITCLQPIEGFLLDAIDRMNEKISINDYKFHPHYYEFRSHSSLDNFVAQFEIKSYTVETYRGFDIDTRVKLQQIAIIQFMSDIGLKYEYPPISFD